MISADVYMVVETFELNNLTSLFSLPLRPLTHARLSLKHQRILEVGHHPCRRCALSALMDVPLFDIGYALRSPHLSVAQL